VSLQAFRWGCVTNSKSTPANKSAVTHLTLSLI
jgi:hypothetical protein